MNRPTTYADVTVRVDVSDVTPEMVRRYMGARGWRESDCHGDCLEFTSPGGVRVWVSGEGYLFEAGREFAQELPHIFGEVAAAEARSPLAVLADIRAVWARALLAERGVTEVVEIAAYLDGGVVVAVYFRDDVVRWPIADCEWLAESRDGLSPTEAVGPWIDWTAWADAVAEAWRTVAGYPACR